LANSRDGVHAHIAVSLSRIPGVASVQVCTLDGQVLATAPSGSIQDDNRLAAFIVRRAEGFGDGDLRGWGSKLSQSALQRIVIEDARQETVIVKHEDGYVCLSLSPGASVETLNDTILLALQRFIV
jgi:predicted regulator of Ras-like GTPase activity (Roadblock/LC7/MglB family)